MIIIPNSQELLDDFKNLRGLKSPSPNEKDTNPVGRANHTMSKLRRFRA